MCLLARTFHSRYHIPAAGLQPTYRRYPPLTICIPILTINIFVALLLNILHIHAYNYSYPQFKAKTLGSDESRVSSEEQAHAGCAHIRARK
jgi:hypothetical protein